MMVQPHVCLSDPNNSHSMNFNCFFSSNDIPLANHYLDRISKLTTSQLNTNSKVFTTFPEKYPLHLAETLTKYPRI